MKILKPGRREADRLFKGTCSSCGCQIEFHQHEGQIIRDSRDGDYIRINCPTCFTYITVAL